MGFLRAAVEMKEEEPSWFARWEEELPSPEELMPLSQTLITPDLALAFDITSHNPNSSDNDFHHNGGSHAQGGLPFALVQSPSQSQHHQGPPSSHQNQQGGGGDYDSSEMGGGGGGGGPGGDDQARTLKRPRLVWTPQLHKRFVDAVAHLGIKNAVPKTIMQLMSVDGLTRENVASHLQKYRLYLKRMQGLSSGAAGHGSAGGPGVPHADPATEQLFASGPVPHPYIGRGPPAVGPGGGAGGGPEQFMPYVPVASLQQHHHHQQMAAAAHHHQQQQRQQQYFHHRHMGHLGLPPGSGFDHGFLARQQHHHQAAAGIHGHRIMGPGGMGMVAPPVASQYAEEFEAGAGAGGGGRTMLTLFPTNDD